jgi:hypothetical protein
MRERRRPIRDPEILELFQDEPELLAVVDAIAATQAPTRRAVTRRVLLVAAFTGIAALALALVPFQLGGRSLEDRALAAVGDGRVVHLMATRVEAERVIIDLNSGLETPGMIALESWFDSETGDLRTETRREGRLVADTVVRKGSGQALDPVVAGFVRGYREALEQSELEVLRRGYLDGSKVVWVRLTLPGAQSTEIALDVRTFLPRAFRSALVPGAPGLLWRVEGIDSRPRSEGDFRPTELPTIPGAGQIEAEHDASLAQANELLGERGRWPGRQVDGLELDAVRIHALSRLFPDGKRLRSSGVELVYGDRRGEYIELRQAAAPEPAYGFAEAWLTIDFAPIPVRGKLALTRLDGAPGRPLWLGQLVDGGVYLSIRSSSRDLVISAARSLAPLR